MSFGINGKDNVNNFFIQKGIVPNKVGGDKTVNGEGTPIDNKAIGEYGDKLLNQVQPSFIQAAKIPEADAVDLQEMFAMAGVPMKNMPTKAQYERIASNTAVVAQQIEDIGAKSNAEVLFDSPEFSKLNELFDIE